DAVALDDRLPVVHRSSPERIDADLHAGSADRFHVDDIDEIGDIGGNVIVAVNAGRFARVVIGGTPDALETVFEKTVRRALHRSGDVGMGRTAIGRIIFETAVFRRIVRRR